MTRCGLEREKRDIESTLYDLESELEQLLINKRKYWNEQAKNLRYSESVFDKKIREIIGNPYLLLRYLVLEREKWKSFRYFKSEIFIPNDWNISQKTDFQDENVEKNIEEESVCKPYGDKWFSPQARRDRNVLRREYRELGKKYHPDNNKNPNVTTIFQDIMAERMEILSNYK